MFFVGLAVIVAAAGIVVAAGVGAVIGSSKWLQVSVVAMGVISGNSK